MIVCIPTKGRPKTKTYRLFEAEGIQVFHFIEPNEIESYGVPNRISIEKNGLGLIYSRNFILEWCRKMGHEWVIMCDDDVSDFGVVKNKKCVTTGASIWTKILKIAKETPFELFGIQYRQYAWASTKQHSINSCTVEVCVLINTKRMKSMYDSNFPTKADRNLCMETVQNGNGIIRFNMLFFNTDGVGSLSGGLHKLYLEKVDELIAKKLFYKWNPFAKMILKGERIDIKLEVKKLAISLGKKVM